MSDSTPFLTQVDQLASTVVAPQAALVDRQAQFPKDSVEALKAIGALGLISPVELGGLGHGHRVAAQLVERLARECGSTAMVMAMHYAAGVVIANFGGQKERRALAQGEIFATLAFSEQGSRSQFWSPVSLAQPAEGQTVQLTAQKSWVTSAHQATHYVWSSRPLKAEGASSLWLVAAKTPGLKPGPAFDGLGLRGNDSVPVEAKGVRVDAQAMLGQDGGGLEIMLQTVLPMFNLLNAAVAVGLMEGAIQRAAAHMSATHFAHNQSSLADLPTLRNYLARARIQTDMARLLVEDTAAALEAGRADAVMRVLECKAAAGEAATQVLDMAMRICGGAAFRHEVAVERYFRDGRAAGVMAPTTDQLYDFIGKALCGLPLV